MPLKYSHSRLVRRVWRSVWTGCQLIWRSWRNTNSQREDAKARRASRNFMDTLVWNFGGSGRAARQRRPPAAPNRKVQEQAEKPGQKDYSIR